MFNKRSSKPQISVEGSWARPEMEVVFRAEVMPGKDRDQRKFRIKTVRPNGRVILHGFEGEHREGAFEPINFHRTS